MGLHRYEAWLAAIVVLSPPAHATVEPSPLRDALLIDEQPAHGRRFHPDSLHALPPEWAEARRMGGNRGVHPHARVLLHVQPVTRDWRALADSISSCEVIRTDWRGDEEVDVVVFVTGVDTLKALQFAVQCDPGVILAGWEPYLAAMSIPSGAWPGSGEWIACVWGSAQVSESGVHPIGRLTLAPGSTGGIAVTPMPGKSDDIGAVQIVDNPRARGHYTVDPDCGLGRATVGAPPPEPYDPCGACD